MGFSESDGPDQQRAANPLEPAFLKILQDFELLQAETGEQRAVQIQQITQQVRLLMKLYGPEAVWKCLVETNIPIDKPGGKLKGPPGPPAYEDESQAGLSQNIDRSERGQPVVLRDSFGLFEPSYKNMLRPETERLKRQPQLNATLFGSMSEHSANEYFSFCKDINPESTVTVIDLGTRWQKGAAADIVKIQGDVTKPIVSPGSQDLVATNMLLRYLKDRGFLPSENKIVSMLKQACFALKKGGVLIMTEYSAIMFKRGFSGSWATRLVLEENLRQLGFADVRSQFALAYPDHLAKKNQDLSHLVNHEFGLSDLETRNITNQGRSALSCDRFAFTLTAKK